MGLEYAVLDALHAESVILCVAEDGVPAKITYRLAWNQNWELISANIQTEQENAFSTLDLRTDEKDAGELQMENGCTMLMVVSTSIYGRLHLPTVFLYAAVR